MNPNQHQPTDKPTKPFKQYPVLNARLLYFDCADGYSVANTGSDRRAPKRKYESNHVADYPKNQLLLFLETSS
jgi:hypothetical protein